MHQAAWRYQLDWGVRCLAQEGKVNVFDIGGKFWLDVDDPKDVAIAERALLNQLQNKPNDGPVSRYLDRPVSRRYLAILVDSPLHPT